VRFDEATRAARAGANQRRGARTRGPNRLQQRKQAEIDRLLAEGIERIGQLSDRDLLIAGTALYAGEGAKTDGVVKFANSDPRMVLLFCAWLRPSSMSTSHACAFTCTSTRVSTWAVHARSGRT
jgi:hypothetical protein